MRAFLHFTLICIFLHCSSAYSKYGRTCKDIGCPSNEVCVMAEDPCSYYNREQCGSYPTCKASGDGSSPSCSTHICPPSQECHLDDGTPKCIPAKASSSNVHKTENMGLNPSQNPSYPAQNPSYPSQNPSYPPQNPSYPPQNPSHNPSAPNYPSGGLYPSLTTARPPSGASYSNYPSGGYPGYPSQAGNYPGYPGYSGYPNYPQQGYPNAYPNANPNQGGYPQYPQGGYYPGYQNTYRGRNEGSTPIVDKITEQLKTIGAGILKNALSSALSGGNSNKQ